MDPLVAVTDQSCVRQGVKLLDQVLGYFVFAVVAAKGVARSANGGDRLRYCSQQLLLLLGQQRHVQVAVALQPGLAGLDAQRPNQTQARLTVREDPHHSGPPLDLFVEPLEHVGALQVEWLTVERGLPVLRKARQLKPF